MKASEVDPHHVGKVIIDGKSLTIEEVVAVARFNKPVQLDDKARENIAKCRNWVEQAIEKNMVIYGVTTGVGSLAREAIPPEKCAEFSKNLIRSHSVGVGNPLPEEIVRAAMLIRANTLAKGYSGVRVEVVETLIEMLNRGVHPIVPEKGSVGASGDLAPLSHMALVLMGEGEAFYKGERMSGKEAMRKAGLKPISLEAKEGLALNNGATFTAAIASLLISDAENLVKNAEIALAMSLEALCGIKDAFNEKIHRARRHDGQQRVARNVLNLIEGSQLVDSVDSRPDKVQDAYSLRCAPQVIGAARDALAFIRMVVENEINAATDNPLIFLDLERENKVISGGNFHGEPLAFAMDLLGIVVAEIGNIAERRIFRLLDRNLNEGLPEMLVESTGLNSGLMLLQYTAAALVSDNKTLAHPDSVDSIPTCANQEDHVSMSLNAARHAREILWNVEQIIAIEMFCAAQALDFREKKGRMPGKGTKAAYSKIREKVSHVEEDRIMHKDIEEIVALIHKGEIVQEVERALGKRLEGLAKVTIA
jgi:histidine ammonia-lyase